MLLETSDPVFDSVILPTLGLERHSPLFNPPQGIFNFNSLTPSKAFEDSFQKNIINPISKISNTNLKQGIIFGYPTEVITKECLQYGRANFNTDWEVPGDPLKLLPYGKVLLYSYFYQRRHFFEMKKILLGANDYLLNTVCGRKSPLLIDFGSGPYTSALALFDAFQVGNLTYFPFDHSEKMMEVGASLFRGARHKRQDRVMYGFDWNKPELRNYYYSEIHKRPPESAILITASYLFGSTSLEVEGLAEFVEGVIDAAGNRKVCFIETNTLNTQIGDKFSQFLERVPSLQSLFGGKAEVSYFNTQAASTALYTHHDEIYGTAHQVRGSPTNVEYRYMVLGNERLALESIGVLEER